MDKKIAIEVLKEKIAVEALKGEIREAFNFGCLLLQCRKSLNGLALEVA